MYSSYVVAKTPWRDGTTHLVMSPLEFMQRLAALVPRPRLHLIRFGVRITSLREVSGPPLRDHGVLGPNAKLLKRVFDLDLEHCPNCGGELKIIAAILWGEPGHKRS